MKKLARVLFQTKNKKNICVVNNVHGLLIYLIECSESFDSTLFIIGDELDNITFLPRLSRVVFNTPKKSDGKTRKLLKYIIYFYIYQPVLRFILKNKIHYGQDHLYFSNLMPKSAIVIEDGERTYFNKPGIASKINRTIFPIRFVRFHGREGFTKKILMTKPKGVPNDLIHKACFVDLNRSWAKIDTMVQRQIMDVFGLSEDVVNTLQSLKSADLLLTQPFSEEGFISENRKLRMYDELTSRYKSSYIVIKPHPRETSQYQFDNKEVIQLPRTFPSQFLNLLGVRFSNAITVNSTAIHGIPAEKTIIDGVQDAELLAALLKNFEIDDLNASKNS